MLNKLSEQIRACLEHADHCACEAAAQPHGSPLKQDYLNLEKGWRSLAQSYQLSEQLTDYTKESRRMRVQSIIPFLHGQAFDPETVKAMANALVKTCQTLGVSERDDPSIQIVAQKIIELAERGLKNPTALHLAALQEFKSALH